MASGSKVLFTYIDAEDTVWCKILETENFGKFGETNIIYHIVQNFGCRKLWRIWRFATNPPKFYLPNTYFYPSYFAV